jgi:hypothetical protein
VLSDFWKRIDPADASEVPQLLISNVVPESDALANSKSDDGVVPIPTLPAGVMVIALTQVILAAAEPDAAVRKKWLPAD